MIHMQWCYRSSWRSYTQINETNGAYVPLLIAGGGGGMPSSKSSLDDLSNSEAKLLPSGSGRNGHAAVPNKAGQIQVMFT